MGQALTDDPWGRFLIQCDEWSVWYTQQGHVWGTATYRISSCSMPFGDMRDKHLATPAVVRPLHHRSMSDRVLRALLEDALEGRKR